MVPSENPACVIGLTLLEDYSAQKFQRGFRPPEGHSVAYLSRDLVVYPDNPRYLIALLSSNPIRHFTRVMWRSAVDNCPVLQFFRYRSAHLRPCRELYITDLLGAAAKKLRLLSNPKLTSSILRWQPEGHLRAAIRPYSA